MFTVEDLKRGREKRIHYAGTLAGVKATLWRGVERMCLNANVEVTKVRIRWQVWD